MKDAGRLNEDEAFCTYISQDIREKLQHDIGREVSDGIREMRNLQARLHTVRKKALWLRGANRFLSRMEPSDDKPNVSFGYLKKVDETCQLLDRALAIWGSSPRTALND